MLTSSTSTPSPLLLNATASAVKSSLTSNVPVAAETAITFFTVFAFGGAVILSVYFYHKFTEITGSSLLVRERSVWYED